MESSNETRRLRRDRNQSESNRDWSSSDQDRNGSKRDHISSQGPNYDSGYRPGAYSQYSDRNKNNRSSGESRSNGRNQFDSGSEWKNSDNEWRTSDQSNRNEPFRSERDWRNDRDFNDISNGSDFSYNNGSRSDSGNSYRQDYNQYNQQSGGADNNWNRGGSSSYDRGDMSGQSGQDRDWWDKSKDEVSSWFGDRNSQVRREQDKNEEHRGKGPKGYSRSDERIREDVNEKLTDDGYIDASEIELDVKNGEVILKGSVRTREEKRRAEDIIDRVTGVKNVENRLKVEGNSNLGGQQYTNGLRENKSGMEYGPGAVSGMANTSPTGGFNTAKYPSLTIIRFQIKRPKPGRFIL